MTAITLLLALLAVAYVGTMLMGGRGLRGYGLPSGAEYMLLGIAAGPHAFGLVDQATLAVFEPIVAMSAAWLALVAGVQYGYVDSRRIDPRRLASGAVLALATAAAVAAMVYVAAGRFTGLSGFERILVAAGAGLVSCETTQNVVRWAVERHGARGPTCEAVADVAVADDAIPLLLISVIFAFAPTTTLQFPIPAWIASVATIPLGIVIGVIAAVLLSVEVTAGDGWGVLLGAALLGTGVAWRLGWSPLTVLFVMGVALSKFSRHRGEIRTMLERTEHAVLLPTLFVAGVQLRFGRLSPLLVVLVAALIPRLLTRFMAGLMLAKTTHGNSAIGKQLGLGLLSTGRLTVVVGIAVSLRYPGTVGDFVLATAIGVTFLGELLGPTSLRRALIRAGEIPTTATASSSGAGARAGSAS